MIVTALLIEMSSQSTLEAHGCHKIVPNDGDYTYPPGDCACHCILVDQCIKDAWLKLGHYFTDTIAQLIDQ